MKRIGIAIAAAALGLSGCSTITSVFDTTAPDAVGHSAYMGAAAASDLFEIESAQLAIAKAQRPDVRAFAEMLLREHTLSAAGLSDAARRGGFIPAAGILDAVQQRQINLLQNAGPNTADALFLTQQVAAHQRAYNLHRNYALTGQSPELREFATMIAPKIQQHLQAAQRLQ